MSNPIGDALGPVEHFAERIIEHGQADVRRVWDDITHHTGTQPYHEGITGTTAQENPVSTLLDEGIAKAKDLVAHLEGLAADALPALEALQGSKIAQVAEKYVLGPDAEQFIADMVDGLAAKYGTAKDTTTSAAEPATPAPAAA